MPHKMPQKSAGRSLFFAGEFAGNEMTLTKFLGTREFGTLGINARSHNYRAYWRSFNKIFFVPLQEKGFYEGEAYCQNVTCKPGRECRVLFSGIAECVCISRCPDKGRPICGSDGLRYRSHCELHRQACLKGRRLR